ncbi:MAG TPA: hypothetical protein VNX01_06380 [Bacteroidia bacterium]|jgi:hypothetical protein|nr:hypothetical protein [Bacteroidia bacterium]
MITEIIKSLHATRCKIRDHKNYPDKPGIYAFFLSDKTTLGQFGIGQQVIYIGIAKKSLIDRDINQHFKPDASGSSSLRRSMGAILKNKFTLKAIPRSNNSNDKKRFCNYKFSTDNEDILSKWMDSNLTIGYWVDSRNIDYSKLRELEKEITKKLLPTLDLDPRTRKINTCAIALSSLRKICREEAKTYILVSNKTNK